MNKIDTTIYTPEVSRLIFQIKKSSSLSELSKACDSVLEFEKSKNATPLDLRIINDELARKMAETRARVNRIRLKILKSVSNELDLMA